MTPEFTDDANNAIKDNAVTWGTTVKAKFKVTAKDNKAIDSNIKFHYAWKVNGTADSAIDIETPTNEQTVKRATVAAEAGKTLTLFVYATDSNDNNRTVWSYTSEGIAVKAIDVSQLYLSASVNGTHTYNGKPQEINTSGITFFTRFVHSSNFFSLNPYFSFFKWRSPINAAGLLHSSASFRNTSSSCSPNHSFS